jgi:hypothetical protein
MKGLAIMAKKKPNTAGAKPAKKRGSDTTHSSAEEKKVSCTSRLGVTYVRGNAYILNT